MTDRELAQATFAMRIFDHDVDISYSTREPAYIRDNMCLDNAIESVIQEVDPERRLIHLMVTERNGFIFIMMTNYCRAEVNFRDGLPVTTKADRRNHGYGIRSMRHAVRKYNGTLTTQIKNDAFELKILIPLKKEAAS